MGVEVFTVTRLMVQPDRTYKPEMFEVTLDLSKLDPSVFYKAVRQERVRAMHGAVQIVRSKKLVARP
ncbi:hypothetical protein D3C71_2105010 [compost metagenome]